MLSDCKIWSYVRICEENKSNKNFSERIRFKISGGLPEIYTRRLLHIPDYRKDSVQKTEQVEAGKIKNVCNDGFFAKIMDFLANLPAFF